MKKQTLLKSTLCLLMAMLCNVAWAQTVTAIDVSKYYTIKCTAGDHVGYIGDNGTTINGKSAEDQASLLAFEKVDGQENQYYINIKRLGCRIYSKIR